MVEREALRKIDRRIVATLFAVFLFNQIDRVNVSFAALQMNGALGLTTADYATGISLFFAAYLAFEIPSNMVMLRVGARIWLTRIIVSWGVIATASAFAVGPHSFWAFRFALGIAEAGFVPGCILYLARWLPREQRCAALAKICLAVPVAVVIGGPLSAGLLRLDTVMGLAGWQWIFLIEGLPSIILGVLAYRLLAERPSEASWLTPAQRSWVGQSVAAEQDQIRQAGGASILGALSNARIWSAAGTFFCASVGTYGIVFWLPQLLKQMSGVSDVAASLLSALPFVASGLGMYFNARHADRTGERIVHFAGASTLSAIGLMVCGASSSPWIGFAGLLLAGAGLGGALGIFWAIPMSFLAGSAGAIGFALINTLSSLAGLASPLLVAWILRRTGSFADVLYCIAGFMLLGAALVFLTRPPASPSHASAAAR
jgi:ACS family tartrate transporter-like MFS transporter